MIKLQLLGNKILIKEIEKTTTTQSGFILSAENKQEKIREAEVVAVGNGSRNEKGERIKLDVEVGQKVMYEHSDYQVHEVEIDKHKYLIVNESDIIGILK